jgi:hypothetical protein
MASQNSEIKDIDIALKELNAKNRDDI